MWLMREGAAKRFPPNSPALACPGWGRFVDARGGGLGRQLVTAMMGIFYRDWTDRKCPSVSVIGCRPAHVMQANRTPLKGQVVVYDGPCRFNSTIS